MKRKCFALLCLTVLAVVCLLPCAAFANSAPKWYVGTAATGVVTTEDCPLEVTREQLTFNIVDFPNWENFDPAGYSSNVVAEYTFENPTDLTVDVGAVFPFGVVPEYAQADIYTDVSKYDVTVDGVPVPKTLRCTYGDRYDTFDISTDLKKLRDDYVQDDYYNGDLKVYKHTYKVELPVKEAVLIFRVDTQRTRLLGDENADWSKAYVYSFDNTGRVSVTNGEELTLYFVGKDVDVCASATMWKSVSDYEEFAQTGKKRGSIDGSVQSLSDETYTFDDLAFLYYDETSGISRVDWYNAVVDMACENHLGGSNSISQFDMCQRLMRWYEYKLHVQPHGTVTNSVTAPLYPTVNYDYEPNVFSYEYLLSPASCWKDFSNLTVTVNTNFYLQEQFRGPNFQSTEAGYFFHSNVLPADELTFSLCEAENPSTKTNWTFVLVICLILAMGASILFGIEFIVPGIVVLIIYLCKRKKTSAKANAVNGASPDTPTAEKQTSAFAEDESALSPHDEGDKDA